MMSNLLPNEKWTIGALSYLCDADGSIQTGPFGTQLHASDYVPSGVPCIMPQDIIDGRISTEKIAYISEENANRLSNFRLLQNDIIYPRRGDIAKHALITSKENGWLCGTGCLRIRLNTSSILPQYLYYYLTLPHVREWIAQNSVGATMPHLNISLVGQISVSYPTYNEQQVITNILGSLDDKIDLNRRMNETLEAMARALFRDWFVDFGPTQAKMAGEAPYLAPELWGLFPDRLDDEGKPEGWEVCNFDELVSINPKEKLSRNTIAPYLSMSELPTQGCLAEAPTPRPFSGGSKFKNGDTLFARITPCLENGKTALAQKLDNNIVGWGSTEFHVLRGKGHVPFSWVYLMARDNEFRTNAIRGMTGTSGRQRVASEVLATYKTVTPSSNQIWKAFDRACNPLFEKIIINGVESRTLAQLRDLLLPKLMSGEISIRDAEKMVEDAA
ncbi:restriction endonuclease subunit S [Komagataeibacter medellinensis]|uniref:restriction endonuclease subunit S n=1 Tax=Komagataeibacter medellinensis TaxID=1177712 RepID=UPI001E4FBCC7|nr:restriction endonuclease subunit S [Komagataeibacter medellinensis]